MVNEGLRERKKAQARQLIEEAALDLFARQGFDSTSMTEVARAVNLSPRTLFRYFDRKDDLIFTASADVLSLLRSSLAGRPETVSHLQALKNEMMVTTEELEQHKETVMRRIEIIRGSAVLQRREGQELNTWTRALVRQRGENYR
jgi:AcrR family transcriptional regulator